MLTMEIWQDAQGRDHADATVNGRAYQAMSRNGVTMKLGRTLRDDGVEDQPFRVQRGGREVFRPDRTLHEWAKWTIAEGDKTRPSVVSFREFSGARL